MSVTNGTQLSLFGGRSRKIIAVRARAGDPDTSHEAAAVLETQQTKLQRSVQTVVEILSVAQTPLSDFDIRSRWSQHWPGGWSDSLPCKARGWAREAGLVRQDGHAEHQGRRVRRWTLGRDETFLKFRQRCPTCNRVWQNHAAHAAHDQSAQSL